VLGLNPPVLGDPVMDDALDAVEAAFGAVEEAEDPPEDAEILEWNGHGFVERACEEIEAATERDEGNDAPTEADQSSRAVIPSFAGARVVRGGAFVFDAEADARPPVWGKRSEMLWAPGETIVIASPPGLGKTTIAQRVSLARKGIGSDRVLGFPVAADPRPVLYIAADRPEQARRSLRRMVREEDRQALDDGLLVVRGVPFDLVRKPEALADLALAHGAGTVVVDVLGLLAPKLSSDETGSAVMRAFAACIETGAELLVLHHVRKPQGDARGAREWGALR